MTLSVADRLDILDVVTRADQAATDRDADAYVRLFTADAVLDGAQGRHAGRDALRAAVGPVWAAEGPVTLHLTLNPVIEDLDEDHGRRVAVRSVLLIIGPGPPVTIRTAAPITQILVRRNGSWTIDRRTVGAPGPPGGEPAA
ncbi:MAG TPA: nuclear transport factor 2 family protein [Streptosporangiaceae bacterium]|nr:nuclear transport factor 2 family protein [Streptosporangiaceae bacterium]